MNLAELLKLNYDAIQHPSVIPHTLAFVKAHESAADRGPIFIKRLTKVASHIHKGSPIRLRGLHGRLHDYCHEGIHLVGEGHEDRFMAKVHDHLYSYAGDFAAYDCRETGSLDSADEALADYDMAASLCVEREPVYAAMQCRKAAGLAEHLSPTHAQFTHQWYVAELKAAEIARGSEPHFAARRLEGASRAARKLGRLTAEPEWYARSLELLEASLEVYKEKQGAKGHDTRRVQRLCQSTSGEMDAYEF